MSSHHVVRDNQEPALVLLNTDSVAYETVGQWLEWSPLVVVTEHTLPFALAHNFKIDAVIVSPEKLAETEEATAHQYPLAIITAANFTAVALDWLKTRQHFAACCITPVQFPLDSAIENSGFRLFVQDHQKLAVKAQGQYQKWVKAGTRFWVEPSVLQGTEGLSAELCALANGIVTFKFIPSHSVWVVEYL